MVISMDLPVTSYEVISNFSLIQECVHGNFTYLVVKWYWLQIVRRRFVVRLQSFLVSYSTMKCSTSSKLHYYILCLDISVIKP